MSWKEGAKKRVGMEAVKLVKDGMTVGLGSGTTAAYMIKEIGRLVSENGLHVLAVPSSSQAMLLAASSGVPITTLDEHPVLDLVIDGADEIDKNFDMIKGGGGALLREKIVVSSAKQVVIVADETKLVDKLGAFKVPVEVLPFGLAKALVGINDIGGTPIVREGQRKMGPVVTDNGNYIVDADFGLIDDAKKLDKQLKSIPGVLETGLFIGLTDLVYLGTKDGITKLKK
ncbi:MAG: ribose-5-phosphate isomerase RpiA [Candidatus Bathyarchaeota archaeon]